MIEIEDCTPAYERLADGDYTLTIESVSEKQAVGKGFKREWTFKVCKPEALRGRIEKMRLFASEVEDVLLTCGGEREGQTHKIKIDYAKIPTMCIDCHIHTEENVSPKDGKTYKNYVITNVKGGIPF